jgi:hypothetical protein
MVDTRTFILSIAAENDINPSRVENIIKKLIEE